MKLSRYGFNVLVMVWLAPVLLFDIIGNTTAVGSESDIYYYKFVVDGVLMAMAAYFVFIAPNAKKQQEQNPDDADTVIGVASMASVEHIYCAILSLYALASWWTLHEVNKASTGVISLGSLIWSLVSIGVGGISALHFYHLKGKSIATSAAEMKKKMTQHDE